MHGNDKMEGLCLKIKISTNMVSMPKIIFKMSCVSQMHKFKASLEFSPPHYRK
jgi:hypothetical protein